MKKLWSAVCALTLVMQLSLAAAAVGPTYTLTLSNTGATSHSFEVYQVFTGDLSVNGLGQKVLSNIVWGSGVTGAGQTAFGNAADKAETIDTEDKAHTFANALVSGGYLTAAATKTVAAGASDSITGLEPGYYLIKDADGSQSGDGSAYTTYMLQVVGDVTASTKLDTPTVTKKVRDINDTGDGDISDNPWHDSADHDIDDVIPYQITGTLPGNYGEYTTYSYAFTDEMSAGLTYLNDARVYVLNGVDETEITGEATISPTAVTAGATLRVSFADLKTVVGAAIDENSRIIIRYTARLNSSAVVGSAGNPNTVYLTYSNNPNPGGSGETGTTPKDKTVVFTYQLAVNKVDEGGDPLENAGFTLYKKDSGGSWQTVRAFAAGTATSFTFTGLDDGDYKLVESDVPEGYNKIDDIEFTISAVHDAEAANPVLVSLNGASADGTTITLSGTQEASVSLTNGTITTSIVNKAGSILPSTGGVGTTIFYAVGGMLVIGAVVLLITKKRMKAEE